MATRPPIADPGLDRLLRSDEPAIRHAALVRLCDRPGGDPAVLEARRRIADGPLVAALLAGQQADGGFGRHWYSKWSGAHWRLVSLLDLGVLELVEGAVQRQVQAASLSVLRWIAGPNRTPRTIEGRVRRCASQEGNALAVAVAAGLADDPRVRLLADSLVAWQWPDGGWNCDARPEATRSSVHESLAPLRGLTRWARATGDERAAASVDRVADFFLRHRVVLAERTGRPLGPDMLRIHYPPYWHYDLLAALRTLAESGHVQDPRAGDALDLLEAKRLPDGRWSVDGVHYRPPTSSTSMQDPADWGGRGPSEPVTLSALLVLKAAGRWPRRAD